MNILIQKISQKLRLLLILIISLWIFTCIPSQAVTINRDLTMEISTPLQLANFEINNLPNTKDLQKFSLHLRDIGRYLGTSQILFGLELSHTAFIHPENISPQVIITDLKTIDGSWRTLTVGYILDLLTQELEVINHQQSQPQIAVLVQDKISQMYHPAFNLPLNQFCNLVLTSKN